MEYGVCGDGALAGEAAAAGFDFVEMGVAGALMPLANETRFAESLARIEAAALPCRALNCFIPGEMKIVGPEVDSAALERYVGTACSRASRAGVETIVFGSGGARRIPDGFDAARAGEQILAFGRMTAGIAGDCDVTVVVEPLSRHETNSLITVGQAADVVRQVDHPSLRLLVDYFHWARDNDSIEDIVAAGPLLAHVHVATMPNRLAPGAEPCELGAFFDALNAGGYDGRVSIEAKFTDPPVDLPRALETMKALAR